MLHMSLILTFITREPRCGLIVKVLNRLGKDKCRLFQEVSTAGERWHYC